MRTLPYIGLWITSLLQDVNRVVAIFGCIIWLILFLCISNNNIFVLCKCQIYCMSYQCGIAKRIYQAYRSERF